MTTLTEPKTVIEDGWERPAKSVHLYELGRRALSWMQLHSVMVHTPIGFKGYWITAEESREAGGETD